MSDLCPKKAIRAWCKLARFQVDPLIEKARGRGTSIEKIMFGPVEFGIWSDFLRATFAADEFKEMLGLLTGAESVNDLNGFTYAGILVIAMKADGVAVQLRGHS